MSLRFFVMPFLTAQFSQGHQPRKYPKGIAISCYAFFRSSAPANSVRHLQGLADRGGDAERRAMFLAIHGLQLGRALGLALLAPGGKPDQPVGTNDEQGGDP